MRPIASTASPLALPAYASGNSPDIWWPERIVFSEPSTVPRCKLQHDVVALNPQIACTPSLLEGNLLDQVKVLVVSTNNQHNSFKNMLRWTKKPPTSQVQNLESFAKKNLCQIQSTIIPFLHVSPGELLFDVRFYLVGSAAQRALLWSTHLQLPSSNDLFQKHGYSIYSTCIIQTRPCQSMMLTYTKRTTAWIA